MCFGDRVDWQIAERGFGDGWYRIGSSEGSEPAATLKSWLEKSAGHPSPGTYGVRAPGHEKWQPFRVDASGTVHEAVPECGEIARPHSRLSLQEAPPTEREASA